MEYKNYLLDTNIVAYFARLKLGEKDPKCERLKENLARLTDDSKLFLCPISVGETEYGLGVAPFKDVRKQQLVRDALGVFPMLDVDNNVAGSYGKLRARLFNHCYPEGKKGRTFKEKRVEQWLDPVTSKELGIQENDLWITAVAYTYHYVLVTNDKMAPIKHIAGPDVEFEDWLA